jgi:hypothetical protein
MQTFKVVLDGVDLPEERVQQIARSVQRAVLDGLADHDAGGPIVDRPPDFISLATIFRGLIAGGPIIVGPIGREIEGVLEKEFRG